MSSFNPLLSLSILKDYDDIDYYVFQSSSEFKEKWR